MFIDKMFEMFVHFFGKNGNLDYNYISKIVWVYIKKTFILYFNKMNTLNSLSPQSVNRINVLIDKINATCDALISALEINSEKVSSYNMTIVDRMNVNSEFIDLVVKNIISIKTHLGELKDGLNNQKLLSDTLDLENLISWLQNTSSKLNCLLISDNNFNNIYSMAILEIQDLIQKVLDEIKIWEIVLKWV